MALPSSSANLIPDSSNGNVWSAGIELALQLVHSLHDNFLSLVISCNYWFARGAASLTTPDLHSANIEGSWTPK